MGAQGLFLRFYLAMHSSLCVGLLKPLRTALSAPFFC
jgi:hypothetical protein